MYLRTNESPQDWALGTLTFVIRDLEIIGLLAVRKASSFAINILNDDRYIFAMSMR